MAYSDEAITFSVIPVDHQIRLEDRVSFAYIEYATVRQDRTGVVAYSQQDGEELQTRIQIPVSGICVLALGPGTSISTAALTSCTRAGATVLFSGGGGVPTYSHATPLTSSSRWAIAQARLVSSETKQRKAALILYKKQLGIDAIDDAPTISVMRGLEGHAMKLKYRELAKKHGIKDFRRQVEGDDPVNQGLNLANSILYGCAASACAALGISPALGIIHRGNARSLLFDLADLYKPSVSLPSAFESANENEPLITLRRKIRHKIVQQEILKDMLATLMELLTPHLPERDDDRLISGRGQEVVGHTQYGTQ